MNVVIGTQEAGVNGTAAAIWKKQLISVIRRKTKLHPTTPLISENISGDRVVHDKAKPTEKISKVVNKVVLGVGIGDQTLEST